MEVWKDIEGYEGFYQVSNFGRVKSLEKEFKAGRSYGLRMMKERILKHGTNSGGYQVVVFSKDEKKRSFSVHRIVAETFIPNPECKKEVNHIDGNKTNNHVDNLEWSTRSENILHAYKMNLQDAPKKKIDQFDKVGKFIKSYNSLTEASKELNICLKTISNNLKGRNKSAGGYVWKYAEKSE